MPKTRADLRLVELGLAESRARAQALILAGKVYSGERRIEKPGSQVGPDTPLRVSEPMRYVSRGGLKLETALAELELDVTGYTCADIGSSTGGFTDCLLQHGAKHVHAIDVGERLIHERLRADPRVTLFEKTNARYLRRDLFPEPVDLAVVDVSFIGIGKLLPALADILDDQKLLLAMIKPQFEIGRDEARKTRGIVRDPEQRQRAIADTVQAIGAGGFEFIAGTPSTLPGPKGNIEHFVLARRLAQRERLEPTSC